MRSIDKEEPPPQPVLLPWHQPQPRNNQQLLNQFYFSLDNLRSTSRLPSLVEDQHATAAVDVINLGTTYIYIHNVLLDSVTCVTLGQVSR